MDLVSAHQGTSVAPGSAAAKVPSILNLGNDVLTRIMIAIAEASPSENPDRLKDLTRFRSTCRQLRQLYHARPEIAFFRSFSFLQQAMRSPGLYSRTETTIVHRSPGHSHVVGQWTGDTGAVVYPLAADGTLIPEHCLVNMEAAGPASGFSSEWRLRASVVIDGVEYSLRTHTDGRTQLCKADAVVSVVDLRVARVVVGRDCLVVLSPPQQRLIHGVQLKEKPGAVHVVHVSPTGAVSLVPVAHALDMREHGGRVFLRTLHDLFVVSCDHRTAKVSPVLLDEQESLVDSLGLTCIEQVQYAEWNGIGCLAKVLGAFLVGSFVPSGGPLRKLRISKDNVLPQTPDRGSVTLSSWKRQGDWLIVVAKTARRLPFGIGLGGAPHLAIDASTVKSWVRLYHLPTWLVKGDQLPWCAVRDLTGSDASVLDVKLSIPTQGPPSIDFLRESTAPVVAPRSAGATTERVRVAMDAQFNESELRKRRWSLVITLVGCVATTVAVAFAVGLIPGAPEGLIQGTRLLGIMTFAIANPGLLGMAAMQVIRSRFQAVIPGIIAVSVMVTALAAYHVYRQYALAGRPPRPQVDPAI